jgi:hypothetical protein
LAFREKLEPEINRELTDAENIYRLRQAGVTRSRVAYLLWGSDERDGAAHGKVGRIYKDECRKRGEAPALDGRGLSLDAFRHSYAGGFVDTFSDRLKAARSGVMTTGGSLVLKNRAEKVAQAFYTRFPDLDPEVIKRRYEERLRAAQAAGAVVKREAPKPQRWTAKDEARWVRNNESSAARAGRAAGERAAEGVEIDRSRPTGRIDA